MEISEINRILRNKAVKTWLCEEWQQTVWNRELSYGELLDIFIRGFDFSVKYDWLDYDFCKEVFPQEELHGHHIYVDEDVDIEGESGYYVFLGDCRGRLVLDGLKATTVYIRHTSHVDIVATGGARVSVRYYDGSTGNVHSDEFSRVKQINH